MTAATSGLSSRGLWRFALSIAVSVVLVALLLRDVSGARIVATIRDAYMPGVLLGAVAFLAMVAARVVRYRWLLDASVPIARLTQITMVRGMLGDLLPARLGTLSYVWLITSRAGVPFDDAMASFLLAFVLDMVAIAPLLLLALGVFGAGVEGGAAIGALAGLLLAGSLVALWLLAPGIRLAGALLQRLGGGASGGLLGLGARAADMAGDVADRVVAVRSRGSLIPVFLVSVLVRITKFGAHWFLLQAVLVPLGVAWGSIGFFTAFLGIAGAEMSAMLPISGIASFGTWEAAFALIFTRLGLTAEQAIVSGFATHILSQTFDYVLGIGALVTLMWPRRRG